MSQTFLKFAKFKNQSSMFSNLTIDAQQISEANIMFLKSFVAIIRVSKCMCR